MWASKRTKVIKIADEIKTHPMEAAVDNTKFIERVCKDGAYVQVITFPRGLGKTYNLTMLNDFLDISKGSESKSRFDGCAISRNQEFCKQSQSKYPVIFISLNTLSGGNIDKLIKQLRSIMINVYKRYTQVFEDKLFKDDKDTECDFKKFINNEKLSILKMKYSLRNLIDYLYKAYKIRVMVLIDDIDKAAVFSNDQACMDFLKHWLSIGLRDSEYLKKAVMTQSIIIKPKYNLYPCNFCIYSEEYFNPYINYFGFSHDDVKRLLNNPSDEALKELKIPNYMGRYNPEFVARKLDSVDLINLERRKIVNAELGKNAGFSHEITNIVGDYTSQKCKM
jgi:hypothetical protein